MKGLLKGHGPGSTEGDMGTQAGGSPAGASESTVTAASEKFTPGSAKEQGYVNVKGTGPTGPTGN